MLAATALTTLLLMSGGSAAAQVTAPYSAPSSAVMATAPEVNAAYETYNIKPLWFRAGALDELPPGSCW